MSRWNSVRSTDEYSRKLNLNNVKYVIIDEKYFKLLCIESLKTFVPKNMKFEIYVVKQWNWRYLFTSRYYILLFLYLEHLFLRLLLYNKKIATNNYDDALVLNGWYSLSELTDIFEHINNNSIISIGCNFSHSEKLISENDIAYLMSDDANKNDTLLSILYAYSCKSYDVAFKVNLLKKNHIKYSIVRVEVLQFLCHKTLERIMLRALIAAANELDNHNVLSSAEQQLLQTVDNGIIKHGKTNFKMLTLYIFYLTYNGLRKLYYKVIGKRLIWSVALKRDEFEQEGTSIVYLENEKKNGSFFADPFVQYDGKNVYIYFEELDKEIGYGCISMAKYSNGSLKYLGPVISEDFHLSFPYIFEYKGDEFMIVESSEQRAIRCYKKTGDASKFSYFCDLLKDCDCAENMIFKYNDQFVLLTNMDRESLGEHSTELHLFLAEDPFANNWLPFPDNPVKIGGADVRNGGFVSDQSGIYRVKQIQEFNFYGKSVLLSKIELNKKSYREIATTSKVIERPVDYIGCHTYYKYEYGCVFDLVKYR